MQNSYMTNQMCREFGQSKLEASMTTFLGNLRDQFEALELQSAVVPFVRQEFGIQVDLEALLGGKALGNQDLKHTWNCGINGLVQVEAGCKLNDC